MTSAEKQKQIDAAGKRLRTAISHGTEIIEVEFEAAPDAEKESSHEGEDDAAKRDEADGAAKTGEDSHPKSNDDKSK